MSITPISSQEEIKSQDKISIKLATQTEATICGYEVKCLTPIRDSWNEWKEGNATKAIILQYTIPATLIVLAILALIGYQTGFFELAQQWASSGGLTNWQVVAITGGTAVGFLALIGLIKLAVNQCSKKAPEDNTVVTVQKAPVDPVPVPTEQNPQEPSLLD